MQRRDVVGTEFLPILFPCALPYFLTLRDKSNRPLKFLLLKSLLTLYSTRNALQYAYYDEIFL